MATLQRTRLKADSQPHLAGAVVLIALVILFLLRRGFHGLSIGASVS
jgi:hypothetical protein